MAPAALALLVATAASVAVVHTLLGPDHYVPFLALARAERWSVRRTLWITTACGAAHVSGSVLLGLLGFALGIGMRELQGLENVRGAVAAWAMLAFGLVLAVWGFRQARSAGSHSHLHVHADGTVHAHPHRHRGAHLHLHGDPRERRAWILFLIFVFGPCEPLIPLVLYAAALGGWRDVALVVAGFAALTILTMDALVLAGLRLWAAGRSAAAPGTAHVAAGVLLCLCGTAMLAGW